MPIEQSSSIWAVIELGFLAALQAVIGGFDSHTVHHFNGVLCSDSISDFDSESVGLTPTTPTIFNAA